MASFKAKFPVLQELFAKNHRGPFGPPAGRGLSGYKKAFFLLTSCKVILYLLISTEEGSCPKMYYGLSLFISTSMSNRIFFLFLIIFSQLQEFHHNQSMKLDMTDTVTNIINQIGVGFTGERWQPDTSETFDVVHHDMLLANSAGMLAFVCCRCRVPVSLPVVARLELLTSDSWCPSGFDAGTSAVVFLRMILCRIFLTVCHH